MFQLAGFYCPSSLLERPMWTARQEPPFWLYGREGARFVFVNNRSASLI